jgi:hypothetical protein
MGTVVSAALVSTRRVVQADALADLAVYYMAMSQCEIVMVQFLIWQQRPK